MLKIEAVIQPAKLDTVKEALIEAGHRGNHHHWKPAVTAAKRATPSSIAAASTPSIFFPRSSSKSSSMTLLKDKVIQAILGAARTGHIGDGKIFVSRIDEAIRIRNDERGDSAL